MLYESALIPSAELDCLLATDGSYPKVLTFAQPSCRAECTTASGFAGQPAEWRIRGALLPNGLTPTERQLLAEAAVEGPTGERRMLVARCLKPNAASSDISVVPRRQVEQQVPSNADVQRLPRWYRKLGWLLTGGFQFRRLLQQTFSASPSV